MHEITILYTFDTGVDKGFNNKLIKLSILTLLREFGNRVHIIIYTTTLNILKQVLHKYLNYIDIRFYDPVKFGQREFVRSEYYKKFKVIGHARVYLVSHLLIEYERPVLYMDNDVAISVGWGNNILSELQTFKNPIGCNFEGGATVNQICKHAIHYQSPFKDKIVTVDAYTNKYVDLPAKTYIIDIPNINNGVLYFPYNKNSIYMSFEMRQLYEKLNEINPIIFNDMFSFTLMVNTYIYTPKYGISGYRTISEPLQTAHQHITHYYPQKYMPKYLNAFCNYFIPPLEDFILHHKMPTKPNRVSIFSKFYDDFFYIHTHRNNNPIPYRHGNFIETSVLTVLQVSSIYDYAPVCMINMMPNGQCGQDYSWFDLLIKNDDIDDTDDINKNNYSWYIPVAIVIFVIIIIISYILKRYYFLTHF